MPGRGEGGGVGAVAVEGFEEGEGFREGDGEGGDVGDLAVGALTGAPGRDG